METASGGWQRNGLPSWIHTCSFSRSHSLPRAEEANAAGREVKVDIKLLQQLLCRASCEAAALGRRMSSTLCMSGARLRMWHSMQATQLEGR